MSIETSLYSTLTGDAGVSALIGTRVYPNLAPEGAAHPLVAYSVISGSHIDTIPGTGDTTRKLVQIDCHANTYSSAKAVAAAVISALEGDGYHRGEHDIYDSQSQVHTVAITWAFMAV